MPLVAAEDLVKTYRVAERRPGLWGAVRGIARRRQRTVRALDRASFALEAGELVGCIGPNGAGKSTTVKLLSGIIVPDSGRCEIAGRVPWRERAAHVAGIGVVFGQRTQLWWDLPVVESFDLLRHIYKVEEGAYRRRLEELAAVLDIEPLLDVPVRQLSLGQRMRCDLAAALLHDPALLFLDEPTIGLDAVSKLAVRGFVMRLNRERGTTVILTTHDMDDVEALCSRVMVIGRGRILMDGTVAALRSRRPRGTVLQLVGHEFQLRRAGRLLQGAIVLAWAAAELQLAWTPHKALLLAAAVAGGVCLFSGVMILQATLCFWTIEGLELMNALTNGGVFAAQYPLSIYRKWFRRFFTGVVPLACVSYYPVLGLLDIDDGSGALRWLAPAAGPLFLLVCLRVWGFGVRRYRSTGS